MDSAQGSSSSLFPGLSSNLLPGNYTGYSDDTTLNQPNFSSPMFPDDKGDYNFGLDGLDSGDLNDQKRRRIARACDLCRRRKIKCDGRVPCSHCKNYNSECVYHFEQKARKPVKTAKYIEGLENRLGRMEHLLRLSGLVGEREEGKTDLGLLEQRLAQRAASEHSSPGTSERPQRSSRSQASGQHSPRRGTNTPPAPASPGPTMAVKKELEQDLTDTDDLAEMMDSLMTNNFGETRYIGSSSGFSIISPRGMQWVNEKLGDHSFVDMIRKIAAEDNKWFHWRPEVFADIFDRRVFTPLPPREECMEMIKHYFETFNNLFPLFHEPTFQHLVEKQYSDDPYTGSGWWASLNVALAISYKTQGLQHKLPAAEERSWAYFKNALAVITELTLRNTDLLSVQALLGMTLYMQGTPNPQPSFVLIASAIRLAHSIGLHKKGSAYGFNGQEIEQRKRVFWIAYMMDKDISLRSGRPAAQDDNDWNVDLPSEDPEDGVGNVPLPDGSGKVNLFKKFAEFGIMNAKVYKRLYSVRASKQTDGELLSTISELDQELEQWKDSLPVVFRPETALDNQLHPTLALHLTLLHLAYYNLLTTIHRRSIHQGYWTGRLAQYAIEGRNVTSLSHRVFSSAALCVTAARLSIALLNNVPANDTGILWLIVYYPCTALMTLFANILQNPQDAHAWPDMKLMNVVVDRLSNAAKEDNTGSMTRMATVCKEFTRLAAAVLDKTEKEMSTRQKRKQERDREKITKSERSKSVISSAKPASESSSKSRDTSDPQETTSTSGTSEILAPNAGTTQALHASQASLSNSLNPAAFPAAQGDSLFNSPHSSLFQTTASANNNDIGNMYDFSQADFQYPYGGQVANDQYGMSDMSGMSGRAGQMFGDMGGYGQQPYIPPELWSAPMNFEWDWADLGNV